MSTNTQLAADPETGRQPAGVRHERAGSVTRTQATIGRVFVSGYTLFLVVFGILPALYAIFLAFTKQNAFVGFDNFVRIFSDYRFWPAVGHVGLYVVVWLIGLLFFVVLLALIVHAIRVRWLSNTARFIYYIPGALSGAASVMLWLFVLDPTVSPVSFILEALGNKTLVDTVQLDQLPVVLAIIAFWTGAGGWIVIMYGALNNISTDVMEAARIDGAGPVSTAWYIQIPLLRKWIAYMAILSLAAGTQLFVEPRVLSQATRGVVPQDYSLNQLAFLYAFKQNDFNGSAAISLVLLVVALGLSIFFVFRGGLFERD
ncbi:multiple sugar transport system permease protein [Leifsonia sp. AK011]|uniref:carbohydrate ABC transporter permease n=1 Tax=Leifsonia sp. AK011 TaxID=2723075 RepID=UPI001838EE08|nr:sugar ABC transporter permease [Leifsonia sp. AK011]NYF09940.1 multiple sugar transport system permease protein [Leifsonia sp. AK011]